MKSTKLYKVTVGYTNKREDVSNWSSCTVIAEDALEAAKKTSLRKNEYVSEIELVSDVDVA